MSEQNQQDLWATAAKSISWDIPAGPPVTFEGDVLSQERAQQVNIETRKPMTWDDGRPRLKNIVTLQTDLKDDEDDDGIRQLHVNIPSALHNSIVEAIKSAQTGTLRNRDHLATTWTHTDEPTRKGLSGQKQFKSLITPAS